MGLESFKPKKGNEVVPAHVREARERGDFQALKRMKLAAAQTRKKNAEAKKQREAEAAAEEQARLEKLASENDLFDEGLAQMKAEEAQGAIDPEEEILPETDPENEQEWVA